MGQRTALATARSSAPFRHARRRHLRSLGAVLDSLAAAARRAPPGGSPVTPLERPPGASTNTPSTARTFDTLRAIVRDALVHGDQPMLHAVGDSAIALVIAAMRAEAPDSVWRRLRPRLEHADGLGRDQLADLKLLGIVVVQNPAHLALPAVMNTRWGADRLRTVDLLRTLVDSGVPLALGSDGPREPGINIMLATLHPNVPGEALTREQAVIAYTRGSAYAAFAERIRGTLAPGMLADLAVVSQDIFTVAGDALPATTSMLTMVGGQVLHDVLPGPGHGGRADRQRVRPPRRIPPSAAQSLTP